MKLRNKKTGEIVVFSDGIIDITKIGCKNVAELYEQGWEDYEEPKGYWYINEFGTVMEITHSRENIYDKSRKNFGNYFETKEEAEKAVEKLKAWKRLKDRGFKFNDVDWMHNCIYYDVDVLTGRIFPCRPAEAKLEGIKKDLDLLFGGED